MTLCGALRGSVCIAMCGSVCRARLISGVVGKGMTDKNLVSALVAPVDTLVMVRDP